MCGTLPDEEAKRERARLQGIHDDIRRILVAANTIARLAIIPKE